MVEFLFYIQKIKSFERILFIINIRLFFLNRKLERLNELKTKIKEL